MDRDRLGATSESPPPDELRRNQSRTGQGEVTAWVLEKTTCREIHRVGGGKEETRGYEAWEAGGLGPGSLEGVQGELEGGGELGHVFLGGGR